MMGGKLRSHLPYMTLLHFKKCAIAGIILSRPISGDSPYKEIRCPTFNLFLSENVQGQTQSKISFKILQAGAGWATTKLRKNCKQQHVQIKTHQKPVQDQFPCLELMFGNMLITSNIKMLGLIMSKPFGKQLIGLIFLVGLLMPLLENGSIYFYLILFLVLINK